MWRGRRWAYRTPIRTLRLGSGTCRDFAVLMIEAVRALGFAARFVSGYLYVPERGGRVGGGATHAWLRVYVPGAGWVELDPTNGIVGNRDLIRVAVARDHRHAVPLHGTWTGFPADSLGMTVEVASPPRNRNHPPGLDPVADLAALPKETRPMRIRAGYQIVYDCPQPTPMLLMVSPHPRAPAGPRCARIMVTYDPPIGSHHYTRRLRQPLHPHHRPARPASPSPPT